MFTINGKTGWVHKDCVYVDRGGFNVYDYCVDDPFEKSVDEISNGLNSLKRELIKGRNPGKAACRGICAHIIKNNLNLLGDCGF